MRRPRECGERGTVDVFFLTDFLDLSETVIGVEDVKLGVWVFQLLEELEH